MENENKNSKLGLIIIIILALALVISLIVKGCNNNQKEIKKKEQETGYKYLYCYKSVSDNDSNTSISQNLYFEKGELKTANIDKNIHIMESDEKRKAILTKEQSKCEKQQKLSKENPWFNMDCRLNELEHSSMQTLDLELLKQVDKNNRKAIAGFSKIYLVNQDIDVIKKTLENDKYECNISKGDLS